MGFLIGILPAAGGCVLGGGRINNAGGAQGNANTIGDTTVNTTVTIGGTTTIYNIGAPKIEQCRKDLDRRGFAYTQEAFLGAVKRGQTEFVKLFLDCGMLQDASDVTTGETALGAAVAGRSGPTARLLLERKANPDLPSGKAKRPPIVDAAAAGQLDVVDILLAAKADPAATEAASGTGALVEAARGGHADVVRRLLAAAPSLAAAQGEAACLAALDAGRLPAAQALAGAGCAADGPTAEAPERVAVGARAEVKTPDGWRPMRAGETLDGGDRVSLLVEVAEPAYVYMVMAGDQSQIVFPTAGDQRIEPGAARRIPNSQGLKFTGDAGTENVIVYATRAPLPRGDVERRTRGLATPAAARDSSAIRLSFKHEK